MTSGWRRLLRIWRRTPVHDVDAELAFHFDERIAELQASGVDPDAARAQAAREFGDRARVRRDLVTIIDERIDRRTRLTDRMGAWRDDLRYVLRSLRRSPGFVVMVAGILALGIGANAAVFSVLDRLFVEAPPGVQNPARVLRLHRMYRTADGHNHQEGDYSLFQITELQEIAARAPSGTSVGAYMTELMPSGAGDNGDSLATAFVTGDYFSVLGVRPARGRFFDAAELRTSAPLPVAVISGAIWQTQYQGRADVVGQHITVNRHPYTIIGVTPGDFHGADNDAAQLWLPLGEMHWLPGMSRVSDDGVFWMRALVRTATPNDLLAIDAAATLAFHHDSISHDPAVVGELDPLVTPVEPGDNGQQVAILTRLAGVSLVMLLIACANVANLMFARGTERRREIAVRLALGIRRRRLVALLMLESGVVTLIGAMVALMIASRGALVLRHMVLPEIHWVDATVNLHVLLAMLGLAILAGLLAGLAPAFLATRPELASTLRSGGRGVAVSSTRLRSALLITQAALSVVLLAGAGLFVRSLHSIETENIGYDWRHLLFVDARVDADHRGRRAEIPGRLVQLADQLRQLPGVDRVKLASNIPMLSSWAASVFLANHDSSMVSMSYVSPGYLTAIGVRMLRGRDLTADDRAGPITSVLVNRAMAQRLWPGQDPLGRCLRLNRSDEGCSSVVGVVSDAHEMRIDEPPQSRFYAPLADTGARYRAAIIVVRTQSSVTPVMLAQVRRETKATFGDWAIADVRTMEASLEHQLAPWRTGADLFAAAGALALLVAMVGVYSVINYTLSQRRHELGIRIALGAQTRNVIRMVVGESLRVTAIGVTIGLILALAGGRLVESMLYHTSARDPVVLGTVTIVLLTVAALASTIPAWRAARVDPVIALRAE